jgi:ferredoxin-NADP reductase
VRIYPHYAGRSKISEAATAKIRTVRSAPGGFLGADDDCSSYRKAKWPAPRAGLLGIMRGMQLILRDRQHLAGNAWAYHFMPSQSMSWKAGQFIRIEVPHPAPDEQGSKRQFTIASAPHEGVVTIATRRTDTTFKHALHALEPGQGIPLLDHPAGDFIWHDWPGGVVFVAQGIGITPIRSILADRAHRGLSTPATLFFANRTPEIPYLAEIQTYLRPSDVHLSGTPWTAAGIAVQVRDIGQRLVYLSGPKSLVLLLAPPYNLPIRQLKQDIFPNYPSSTY